MTLPSSGPISISQVATELGIGNNLDLNNNAVRTLFGKSSGSISLSDGRGKSKQTGTSIAFSPFDSGVMTSWSTTSPNAQHYDQRQYTDILSDQYHNGLGSSSPSPAYLNGHRISAVLSQNINGNAMADYFAVVIFGANIPQNLFNDVSVPGWGKLYTSNPTYYYPNNVDNNGNPVTVWQWSLKTTPGFPAWTQLTFE